MAARVTMRQETRIAPPLPPHTTPHLYLILIVTGTASSMTTITLTKDYQLTPTTLISLSKALQHLWPREILPTLPWPPVPGLMSSGAERQAFYHLPN